MKTLKVKISILLLIGSVVFNSCVEDDDFDAPEISIEEPILDGPEISISAIAGQLTQIQEANNIFFEPDDGRLDYTDEDNVVTFGFSETNQYLVGYVISSDEGGNYFEELILQDRPENPTIGIKLLIDVNPLFVRYEVGRKIYIKLNGLGAGITNGLLTIGLLAGNTIDKIPSASENDIILRSAEIATIVPLPLLFEDFEDDKTNLFIKLQDVQFNRNQVLRNNPLTFASEGFDQFDGERILESCTFSSSVVFSTSTFSDFKSLKLPTGRGSIDGIFTKNFFGDTFNVVVNSPEAINFVEDERCDPDFLECPETTIGNTTIFFENFTDFSTYEAEGWTTTNVSDTDTNWFISSFSNNFFSRISAEGSGEEEANVWLITPAINMDATTNELLSFDVEASFDNGTNLSAFISNDFVGDPTTATWQLLDAFIPKGPNRSFGGFENSGAINISCIDGNAYIGFFYEGADPGISTRYHLDNIRITGN